MCQFFLHIKVSWYIDTRLLTPPIVGTLNLLTNESYLRSRLNNNLKCKLTGKESVDKNPSLFIRNGKLDAFSLLVVSFAFYIV